MREASPLKRMNDVVVDTAKSSTLSVDTSSQGSVAPDAGTGSEPITSHGGTRINSTGREKDGGPNSRGGSPIKNRPRPSSAPAAIIWSPVSPTQQTTASGRFSCEENTAQANDMKWVDRVLSPKHRQRKQRREKLLDLKVWGSTSRRQAGADMEVIETGSGGVGVGLIKTISLTGTSLVLEEYNSNVTAVDEQTANMTASVDTSEDWDLEIVGVEGEVIGSTVLAHTPATGASTGLSAGVGSAMKELLSIDAKNEIEEFLAQSHNSSSSVSTTAQIHRFTQLQGASILKAQSDGGEIETPGCWALS